MVTNIFSQSRNNDTVNLGRQKVIVKLPDKYKKNIFNYDEGIFIDYMLENGAIITLFSGSNQRLPLLSLERGYIPTVKYNKNSRKTSLGILNGKFWREDNYKYFTVLYDNVRPFERSIFDSILDSLAIISEK